MRDANIVIGIAIGGACGAVARHLVSNWLNPHADAFPWGTLAVNLIGCFFLGWLMYAVQVSSWSLSPTLHVAITTGFLGALTTFSTFGHETIDRVSRGMWVMGLLNIAAHLLLGLLAVGLGRWLADWTFVARSVTD